VKEPLPERLRWRAERAAARMLGRHMRCAACGEPVAKVLPVVWRGRLVLLGLRVQEPLVRVRFGERDKLELLHGELHTCPTEDRPWARSPDIWPS
jgi:hypothetical protein